MTTYYVATLARYVLVDANNEFDARERGYAALHDLYADLRERLGKRSADQHPDRPPRHRRRDRTHPVASPSRLPANERRLASIMPASAAIRSAFLPVNFS